MTDDEAEADARTPSAGLADHEVRTALLVLLREPVTGAGAADAEFGAPARGLADGSYQRRLARIFPLLRAEAEGR